MAYVNLEGKVTGWITPDRVVYSLKQEQAWGIPQGYNGKDIRLLSCYMGRLDDGFAQELSNKMGVRVLAATEAIAPSPSGELSIIDDGIWQMFFPGGTGGLAYAHP